MAQIILNQQQSQIAQRATEPVEIRDDRGRVLGWIRDGSPSSLNGRHANGTAEDWVEKWMQWYCDDELQEPH